jgi:hypothetical protein
MQTIWDLLPASLWPTQPFIPPAEAARTMQMWQALQASGNSSSPYNRADPPWTRSLTPMASASGGEDHSATSTDTDTQGGILGAIFGEAANSSPATNPGMLQPPTPHRLPLGFVGNAQLATPPAVMAQWAPGAIDGPGIGAAPTAAPGLRRAVGDLPARTPQSRYWAAQHGIDSGPSVEWAPPGNPLVPLAFGIAAAPALLARDTVNTFADLSEAAMKPLPRPPAGSSEDDGGMIWVKDKDGQSRPWYQVDPVAAHEYYSLAARKENLAPEAGLAMLEVSPFNRVPAGSVGMFGGPPTKPVPVIKPPSTVADVVSHAPAVQPPTPATPPWLQPSNVPLLPPPPPRLALPPPRPPQYVVRGGLSAPETLRRNASELIEEGHPGSYGISSAMDPNSKLEPGAVAAGANIQHPNLTYSTWPELNDIGYKTIPTPLPGRPLHASILLKPGETMLSPEEAKALSDLLQQNLVPNPNYVKPVKPPKK